ncbi:hypothetical protein SDC9_126471 [bioreactor metagenome]|uniref:Uncharacterized protein n=1 Tax=bioreactor metagenome TaxID=1076179 RepID=A0A645CRB3_9ZZZZ
MRRIAAHPPVNGFADGEHAPGEAVPAAGGILVQTRFVVIQLIMLPVLDIGHIGHQNVGPGQNSRFAAPVVQRLKRGRGRDVHIVKIKPRRRDHPQPEFELRPIELRRQRDITAQRRIAVRQPRPHAQHIHPDGAEEFKIGGEIVRRLSRQSGHHAAAELVAQTAQRQQRLAAAGERVIQRMNPAVKPGIGGFDAQQITLRSGFAPAAIDRLGLFAQTECDAHFFPGKRPDPAQNAFDVNRILLGFDFPRLKHDGAVTLFMGPLRHAYGVIFGQPVTDYGGIAPADAAVETILGTDIAKLDQAAQHHFFAEKPAFQSIGDLKQLRRIDRRQQRSQFIMGQIERFPHGFFKQWIHRVISVPASFVPASRANHSKLCCGNCSCPPSKKS